MDQPLPSSASSRRPPARPSGHALLDRLGQRQIDVIAAQQEVIASRCPLGSSPAWSTEIRVKSVVPPPTSNTNTRSPGLSGCAPGALPGPAAKRRRRPEAPRARRRGAAPPPGRPRRSARAPPRRAGAGTVSTISCSMNWRCRRSVGSVGPRVVPRVPHVPEHRADASTSERRGPASLPHEDRRAAIDAAVAEPRLRRFDHPVWPAQSLRAGQLADHAPRLRVPGQLRRRLGQVVLVGQDDERRQLAPAIERRPARPAAGSRTARLAARPHAVSTAATAVLVVPRSTPRDEAEPLPPLSRLSLSP